MTGAGCAAKAPDGNSESAPTDSKVLASTSSVGGGERPSDGRESSKVRCAHFSGVLSLLKDFESAFWGCQGTLPT
jgi:hypothetical protein